MSIARTHIAHKPLVAFLLTHACGAAAAVVYLKGVITAYKQAIVIATYQKSARCIGVKSRYCNAVIVVRGKEQIFRSYTRRKCKKQ